MDTWPSFTVACRMHTMTAIHTETAATHPRRPSHDCSLSLSLSLSLCAWLGLGFLRAMNLPSTVLWGLEEALDERGLHQVNTVFASGESTPASTSINFLRSRFSLSLSLSMSTWIALGFVRAVSRLLLGFCGDLEEALEGRTVPTHCKSGEHKLYKSYLLLLAICRNWRERYIQLLSGILFCFRGRSLSASSDDQVLHLQFASFIPSFPHDFSEFVDVFMVCSCFASWLVFVLRIYRGWVSADGA
jgi:hypothetical protein